MPNKLMVSIVFLFFINSCNQFAEGLSDERIILLQTENFSKSNYSGGKIELGKHNGISVIAYHPCSDLCPEHAVRIVHYDLEIDKCTKNDGIVAWRMVPANISIGARQFCVPAILQTIPEYKRLDEHINSMPKPPVVNSSSVK